MKKKLVLIIGTVVLVLAAAAAVVLYRHRGGDIVGVTTYLEPNRIIANMTENNPFASGQGTIAVEEGEHIHVEYTLSAGTCDLAFSAGTDSVAQAVESADAETLPDLPVPEDWQDWEERMSGSDGSVFGESGLTGTGNRDYTAAPGTYTAYFYPHSAAGSVKVTAEAD